MRACTCTRVVRAYAHGHATTTRRHLASPAWLAGWCESPEQGRCEGEATRGWRRRAWRAEWARGREAEGGSVCPEPTLNRRSMGHTLEENGKWGSWRGWLGKDTSVRFLSLTGTVSFSLDSLIPLPRVLDALLLPHPPSLPPAGLAAHPPLPFPSFHRYLISFSHPPLAMGEPPHTPL